MRVTTKSNSLGPADLSSVNFGAWLVKPTWCGPALPGFSGAVHAENPDVFYRRNHREVGCVIDCLHKHKLTVSHADNHLFHLTIVSNRFPSLPLCPWCQPILAYNWTSPTAAFMGIDHKGDQPLYPFRRPFEKRGPLPALWVISLMRVAMIAIYLADYGPMTPCWA